MKPKSRKVKFDSSWFALLPAHLRGNQQFMWLVAHEVKRKNIRRNNTSEVEEVIRSLCVSVRESQQS